MVNIKDGISLFRVSVDISSVIINQCFILRFYQFYYGAQENNDKTCY